MEIVRDVACPACGCVCDDLELSVQEGRLVRIEPSCPLADAWYATHAAATRAPAEIDGRAVELETALAKSGQLLAAARYPLIYGLSRSATAGQRAAVRLADRIGAVIDTTASLCHGPSIMALQQVGEPTSTLGEIRGRADLVIFWGSNPAETHPRHAERYSVSPRGEFIGGRDERCVVMVGDEAHVEGWRLDRAGSRPDVVIPLRSGRDFEALTTLRALVRGKRLRGDSAAAPVEFGGDLPVLKALAGRMKAAKCGVVFFGLGLTGTGEHASRGQRSAGHLNVGALLRLVAELNAFTRFHARRMRLYGDVSGADSVLCWQTGFPFSVSLAGAFPRYNPGEFSAQDMLEWGEPDLCLLVGSETLPLLSESARAHLKRIPTIALDYAAAACSFVPSVRITTAVYGLHAGGTAYRMDEVPISLRSVLPSDLPTDESVLTSMRVWIERGASIAARA